jgi:hypothetical protein
MRVWRELSKISTSESIEETCLRFRLRAFWVLWMQSDIWVRWSIFTVIFCGISTGSGLTRITSLAECSVWMGSPSTYLRQHTVNSEFAKSSSETIPPNSTIRKRMEKCQNLAWLSIKQMSMLPTKIHILRPYHEYTFVKRLPLQGCV